MRQLLTLSLLFAAAVAEIYNFDYSQHGADWEEQAPAGADWSHCSSSNYLLI